MARLSDEQLQHLGKVRYLMIGMKEETAKLLAGNIADLLDTIDALKSELLEKHERYLKSLATYDAQLAPSPCGVKGHIARDCVHCTCGAGRNSEAHIWGCDGAHCTRCVEVQKAVSEALTEAAGILDRIGPTHWIVSSEAWEISKKIRALIPPVSKERTDGN